MISFILKLIYRWQLLLKTYYLHFNSSKLQVKDFTIISSNCWGGIAYQDLGLSYKTPFVNMFIYPACFVKLARNFSEYIQIDLVISNKSKYFPEESTYPIGHLKDVEIHFIHYSLNESVIDKWNQRKERINYDKLLFVLSERDNCTLKDLNEFEELPIRKIIFTAKEYNLKSSYKIISMNSEVLPADIIMGFTYMKVDIISFLNNHFIYSE